MALMALPFEEHLNTNYAPSCEELLEISRILREPQTHLARMNDEIERVQATLDGLKCQRDELVQRIDQYLALTSPIRRIPREILQEVFVNCLPTNRNAVMSAHEAPLLLGRVCSSWRSISLSTPRLWTTVHISMPNPSTDFHASGIPYADYAIASKSMAELRTAALREWLQRSGSLPVDISLSQWESDVSIPILNMINPPESQPVVDTILSVAHRWRKIAVAAPGRTMACFLTRSPHDLPFLDSLDFDFSKIRSWGPLSRIPKSEYNIYRVPSLRNLSLMQLPEHDCLQLPVNWVNLTDLTIEGPWGWDLGLSLGQGMELLLRCPRLVCCKLEFRAAEETPVQFSPLTLSNLERLSISAVADVSHMLNCLNLPVLREFEYHTALAPNAAKKSLLPTFFRKLDGSIQKFTTNPQVFTREDLIECLRFIPGATSLAFKRPRGQSCIENDTDSTILDKELLYSFLPFVKDALCPKLEFLEISSRLNFSDEDLMVFILGKQRANFSHGPKLKHLKVTFLRSQRIDIARSLTEVIEEGLNLQLTYRTQPARRLFSPWEGLSPNTIQV